MGTASGFLVGTYVPLGVLPDFAQLLMECTPATYIAALYRQVLMKEAVSETFKGRDDLLREFQEKMGVQLKWQALLTKEQTYLIVLGGILLALGIWISLAKRSSKRIGVGMKIRFEEKQDIPENNPCVVIQAKQLSDQAREVMDYLEQFSTVNQVVIPIKTDDHLIMVKIDDIILAEIDKNQLTIYTTDKTFTVRDTLTNFQHRINRRNFLQISRHAVMNIDHLESLSDSFSGNMMAKLTRGVKSSVSRKYVKSLMDYLGV